MVEEVEREEAKADVMDATRRSISDLKERVDKLAELVGSGRSEVEKFTRASPMVALGVAFIAGIASGALYVGICSDRG